MSLLVLDMPSRKQGCKVSILANRVVCSCAVKINE
jgi:hypothetical protein